VPEVPLRIEAASLHGLPVFFRVIGPWTRAERMEVPEAGPQSTLRLPFQGFLMVVAAFAIFLAWRNYRAGRGDLQGASRLALFYFALIMVARLWIGHHSFNPVQLIRASVVALAAGAGLWILYVALEPYVRRRWPQSIISWNRLLGGGVRDPLVGGHMLYGIALGVGLALLVAAENLVLQQRAVGLNATLDGPNRIGMMAGMLTGLTIEAMLSVLILVGLRVMFSRQWLAAAGFVMVWIGLGLSSEGFWIAAVFSFLRSSLFLANLLRFGGLLPTIVCGFIGYLLANFPMTTDLSDWYSGSTIFAVAVVLALTAYAFHTAVAGRSLVKDSFV
jgi:serine/threonine-protein kinase